MGGTRELGNYVIYPTKQEVTHPCVTIEKNKRVAWKGRKYFCSSFPGHQRLSTPYFSPSIKILWRLFAVMATLPWR